MQMAIDEARMGWGKVAPNPMVGCVILNSSYEFIAKGHHETYGGDHAEVKALKNLNPKQLEGAHVFVSLEPCAHFGKTPPCAKMLSDLPIQSVTYGLKDPNPLVNGKGLEILKKAGKDLFFLTEFESMAKELVEIFSKNMLSNLPFVAMKVASTSKGFLSTGDPNQPWISNALSRKYAHYLRAGYDAVLVGRNTIETDNPQLNIRLEGLDIKNKVVVLDPEGKIKNDKKIFGTHKPQNIILVCDNNVSIDLDVQIIKLPTQNGIFDLSEVLAAIFKIGIRSVFIEGGAITIKEFLKQEQIDRAYIFESTQTFNEKNRDLPYLDILKIKNSLRDISTIELDGDIFSTGLF